MVRTQVPDTPTRRALGSVAAVPYGASGAAYTWAGLSRVTRVESRRVRQPQELPAGTPTRRCVESENQTLS